MKAASPFIKINLSTGKIKEYPQGIAVNEIIKTAGFPETNYPVIAAKVNNTITSLSYRIVVNSTIEPITLISRTGTNIYRRSLCFLLHLTSRMIFPQRRLVIGHSLGKGYFYYFDGLEEIPQKDLELLSGRMKNIVRENLPITRKVISYMDAVDYFHNNNQPDTELLLKYRNDPKIPVYECGGFLDIAHEPLVPWTGILTVFEIMNYPPGFLLRYFSFNNPGKIEEFKENPVLFSIYREYKTWGKILKVHCVGALNESITRGKIKEFIQVAEALHNKKILEIADKIAGQKTRIRVILIAGPSSSGKTTFAKRLAIQLCLYGFDPVHISIDNYFLPRDKTPVDEDGNYNFETIKALDIALFNEHLSALLRGKEIEMPDFNFVLGDRKPEGFLLRLEENGIIICEGIHLLNEVLTSQVKKEQKFKIYVSALTQLNLDDHSRISTTDNRLIRRIVRDNQFRGYSAQETLTMWKSVRRGENTNIFPFQNSADTAFNSALDYELSILKVYAEPLLKTIKPNMENYDEATRLLSFLSNFTPVPSNWVPSESILREFIGESSFKY
ncbi:MAG: nucleoside kinase [Spirochaetales bacterium]|nr:nucleoside kinase [Spirochaetales bacterium]